MNSTMRLAPVLLFTVLIAGPARDAAGQSPVAGYAGGPLDPPAQLMLVRNALTLLNHGNLTGNYTVLRDLASPRFRQRNSAADLSGTFANLRLQKLDLSPILVIPPQFNQPPQIVGDRLQMVGLFPTRPQAVQFALAFQQVEGGWMIDEISLRVAPVEEPRTAVLPTNAAGEYRPATTHAKSASDIRTAERGRPESHPR
jgi:hypothetical protein